MRRLFRSKMFAGAILGAAVSFFMDPQQGRRRRAMTRDRTAAAARRALRRAGRKGRGIKARTYGLTQRLTHHAPADPAPNDPTLAHKVESEVLRRQLVDKGRVNVNAEFGVVVLRGEVDEPHQIREIEVACRKIPGVRDVRNMLHVAGTPAGIRG